MSDTTTPQYQPKRGMLAPALPTRYPPNYEPKRLCGVCALFGPEQCFGWAAQQMGQQLGAWLARYQKKPANG